MLLMFLGFVYLYVDGTSEDVVTMQLLPQGMVVREDKEEDEALFDWWRKQKTKLEPMNWEVRNFLSMEV
jgi:hypothetical protein